MDLFNQQTKGAIFSDERTRRYMLFRIWDNTKPKVAFIGLNPSTANETEPDPTITRVCNFANSWGYGGVYMLNLFSIISPKPAILKKHPDPIGHLNDSIIKQYTNESETVIFAWGDFQEAKERAETIIKMFPSAKALIINKSGSPRHPLYVKGNVKPINFL